MTTVLAHDATLAGFGKTDGSGWRTAALSEVRSRARQPREASRVLVWFGFPVHSSAPILSLLEELTLIVDAEILLEQVQMLRKNRDDP